MLKKIWILFVCLFLVSGCSQNVESKDPDQLAEALIDQGTFETGFIKLEKDQLESFYPGIDAICQSAAIYESDSQMLQLVAVIKTQDLEQASSILQERQSYLLRQAENYFPEQQEMVENALLTVSGDCAILVISSDNSQAEQIIKETK